MYDMDFRAEYSARFFVTRKYCAAGFCLKQTFTG